MKPVLKAIQVALLCIIFTTSCNNGVPVPEKAENKDSADKLNNAMFNNDKDQKANAAFVNNAIAGNYAEIELAKMAGKRSKNSKIQSIAETLEKEHGVFLDQLKLYAHANAITIPAEETARAKEKEKSINENKDFDKAWIDYLIYTHRNTVAEYEAFNIKTSDESLKKWLSETLPKIKMHLSMLLEQESYLPR